MDNNKKLLEGMLKADGINPAGATESERIAFGKMLDEQSKSKQPEPGSRPDIWRIIMKSRITKLAAAAVIIIAAMIGINQFGGSINGASVAWAELAQHLEQIQTVAYRMSGNTTYSRVYISQKHGSRIDEYRKDELASITYLLAREHIWIMTIPEQKKYKKLVLPPDAAQKVTKQTDPRYMVKLLMSGEYKELGPAQIQGIEVEGIEAKRVLIMGDRKIDLITQVWVDTETDLPVRIDEEYIVVLPDGSIRKTKTVRDQFHWDVELEASKFEPNIPDDYTLLGK